MSTINPAAASQSGSGSRAADSLKSLSGDYQNFIKLLTVQLKNQDPTAPLDVAQMTNQIAQLSTVEQQINMNQNLEKLIALTNATQFNNVVGYIGKEVEAPGDQGALVDGRGSFSYYLGGDAPQTTVKIKTEAGAVVYEGPGPGAQGRNVFVWNGKDSAGNPMPNGIYSIEVTAQDAAGNTIESQPYTSGVVTAVDSVGGEVYLAVSRYLSLKIGAITSIRQPGTNNG